MIYADDFNRPDEQPAAGWTSIGTLTPFKVERTCLTHGWPSAPSASGGAPGTPATVFDFRSFDVSFVVVEGLDPVAVGPPATVSGSNLGLFCERDIQNNTGLFAGAAFASDGFSFQYGNDDIWVVELVHTGFAITPGTRVGMRSIGGGFAVTIDGEDVASLTFAQMDADAVLQGEFIMFEESLAETRLQLLSIWTDGPAPAIDDFQLVSLQATASFATTDEFAARLGLTLTTDETTRAADLLAQATGMIQDEFKQQIFFDANDTLTMPSVYDNRFRLPQRPVVSVASITLDGTVVEPEWWYLDGDEIVLKPAFGGFEYLWGAGRTRSWRGPQYQLVVEYAHGYDPVPATAKNICMEMVVRVWVNPGSVAREADGNTSVVYDNNRFSPSGMLMSDTEKETLRGIFGRHSGTVQLR